MQLVQILLGVVTTLTVMSGVVVFMGANRGDKARSFCFFLATIFSTIWTASIVQVYTATPGHADNIELFVKLGLTSVMWADAALLGYIAWKVKYGKLLTLAFVLIFGTISAFIFLRPELMYSQIILKNNGSGFEIHNGAVAAAYVIALVLFVIALSYSAISNFLKLRKEHKKDGGLAVLVGYAIADTVVFAANFILPSLGQWGYTWLGPLSLSIVIIVLYYTILRYRAMSLSSIWLKIFSYVVIAASFALVYMIIFFIIFSAMFRGATPSTQVIILNFVMILIFIALLPATNELGTFIKSLILGQTINLARIAKKIINMPHDKIDFTRLAVFLSDQMSVTYVGFTVNGRYFGSSKEALPVEALSKIERLEPKNSNIWISQGDKAQYADGAKIAVLRNARGDEIGRVIIGKAKNGRDFTGLDMAKIETIINLISTTINTKKRETKNYA